MMAANYKGQLYNLPFNMNTFYGMSGVRTPEEAKAKIGSEIDQMPRGFDAGIGKQGRGLRGGQKQRLLIARALYRNHQYLLLSVIGGDKYYFDQQGHYLRTEQSSDNIINIGNQQMTLSGTLEGLESGNGSGVSFTGSGVSAQLFAFLAQNTTVEWAYGYNSGQAGGLIGTSNQEHGVDIGSGNWNNYGTIAHNHGQSNNGMSKWELEELNGLPSQADIDYLIKNNKESGSVYNETTGFMFPYDRYSKTQEEWLQEHGYEY